VVKFFRHVCAAPLPSPVRPEYSALPVASDVIVTSMPAAILARSYSLKLVLIFRLSSSTTNKKSPELTLYYFDLHIIFIINE